MAFSLVAKHHQVVSNLLTRSSSVATNRQFYGLAVKCVQRVLLNRIPHTLCTYESDGVVKDLSLRIPGTEKRIETAEALNVFLEMEETEDCYYSDFEGTLVKRLTGHNVLFITAYFCKKNNSSARYYTSRINLGKQHRFKILDACVKDGGLTVTLGKNQDGGPTVTLGKNHHHLLEDN